MPYDAAVEELGRDRARELWQLTEAGLDRMAELAGETLRRTGSLRLAVDETEVEAVRREHDALAADGFAVEWHDRLRPPLAGRFLAALGHPPDGALQPARWARHLGWLAAEAGADLQEQSRVRLEDLEAEQVVIATDGYGQGLSPELDAAVRPARAQVVATEALPKLLFPRPHYARYGYDYWLQTPDRRLVIGGWRDANLEAESTTDESTTEEIQDRIEAFVRDLIGRPVRVTHRWAGIFGITEDRLPLVGRLAGSDRVWVAAGYSGHGNVLGLVCGEMVAEAILGQPRPQLALFDPARVGSR
jgi:glycine/D-amino acid oxidase-like deaminating enzyme